MLGSRAVTRLVAEAASVANAAGQPGKSSGIVNRRLHQLQGHSQDKQRRPQDHAAATDSPPPRPPLAPSIERREPSDAPSPAASSIVKRRDPASTKRIAPIDATIHATARRRAASARPSTSSQSDGPASTTSGQRKQRSATAKTAGSPSYGGHAPSNQGSGQQVEAAIVADGAKDLSEASTDTSSGVTANRASPVAGSSSILDRFKSQLLGSLEQQSKRQHEPRPEHEEESDREYKELVGMVNREMGEAHERMASASEADNPLWTVSPTRPTLDEIQNAAKDGFASQYKSSTAWDPQKDYAMIPNGPEVVSETEQVLRKDRKHITMIIDGDNLKFQPRHMRLGHKGGVFAYNELKRLVARKHSLNPDTLDLRLRIFAVYPWLVKFLERAGLVARFVAMEFFEGLADANPHNYIVNVRKDEQAADKRVKVALADAVRDPDCFRVYLGGIDDFGYMPDLRTLYDFKYLPGKVHLIQVPSHAAKSRIYKEMAASMVDLDYIFLGPSSNAAIQRLADKDQVLRAASTFKEHDVPCAYHHLSKTGCLHEACGFSHKPISQEQKEEMRRYLKQRRCSHVARGEVCKYGDDCLFG
ncbi:uncharacterized protein PSFLO_01460 [Pseudozyma flocculosa]|uniref:C3H1-type domain-containing protein n=2 Tax=Pseudozyma flocculosa TaxID=84751 RepID=A0A5C3EXY6_9BASI|nr:uncharacterized protein PSFLO_01460 [Pseudozyma flocculosa]